MNIHAHGDGLRRRDEILRIVGEQSVQSQDELLALLKKRGFKVTQPTLSRDLRELGVAKSPNGYVTRDAFAGGAVVAFAPRDVVETRLEQAVAEYVTGADTAGNLVVIRTPAASAQPVASAIDAASIDGVLGTIGGDDTIFVAFRTPSAASAFVDRVRRTIGVRRSTAR
ncbi:MAG: transcriptional regulator of arginine metabolism [Thermoanaerobaculia bacterium]|jgi:transcriptional regulator of arginine metabolism|nr:transcriptional regulator of arginine metabolism [Thermoanaerobaculia bacterium]